jgi:hypothetical protein
MAIAPAVMRSFFTVASAVATPGAVEAFAMESARPFPEGRHSGRSVAEGRPWKQPCDCAILVAERLEYPTRSFGLLLQVVEMLGEQIANRARWLEF